MRFLGLAALFTFTGALAAQQVHPLSPDRLAELADQQLARVVSGLCPVELSVHQRARSPFLFTSASPALHPVYQVNLLARPGKKIREVAVRFAGPTGPHLELAGSDVRPADSSESFTLTKVGLTNVRTEKLTAVRWVDVVSITYADGSSWRPDNHEGCRVMTQGVHLLK